MKRTIACRLSLLEAVTITLGALLATNCTSTATIWAIPDGAYPQTIRTWLLRAWHSLCLDYTGATTGGAVTKSAFAMASFTINRGWIHPPSIEALKLPGSTTIRTVLRELLKSCGLFFIHFGLPCTQSSLTTHADAELENTVLI